MKRLVHRLIYWFEVRLPRGGGFQLVILLGLLAALAVAGGVAARRIRGSTVPESIWWAFLRLTDTGYMGSDESGPVRAISVILSLGGNLLLCGAVVAIFTTSLDRYLTFLDQGRGRLVEDGHFLILGWNARIPALVEELSLASRRLGLSRPCIVILSEKAHPRELAELRRRLPGSIRRRCRLLLRTGSPLEVASLMRVDVLHARSILIIAEDDGNGASSGRCSDMTLAKVMLTLKAQLPEPGPNLRAAVVEVRSPPNKVLTESVGWPDRTRAVVTLEILGRLLAQSIRLSGIAIVYRHLLTDTCGESLYFASAPELTGLTLHQLQGVFAQAIPVGICKAASPLLLADLSQVVEQGDQLVLLAPSQRACDDRVAVTPLPPGATSEISRELESTERRLLIIGAGPALGPLLHELACFTRQTWHVCLVAEEGAPSTRPQNRLDLELCAQRIDTEEDLVRLNPGSFDNIVILSQVSPHPLEADAASVMLCVLLDRILGPTGPPIIVQLNYEDNQQLLSSRHDVLVTDKLMSHLLAQVSVEPGLLMVYEDLFTSGGAEIHVDPLSRFFSEVPGQLDFSMCQEAAARAGRVALGLHRSDPAAGLQLNPPRRETFQPKERDALITVAYGDGEQPS